MRCFFFDFLKFWISFWLESSSNFLKITGSIKIQEKGMEGNWDMTEATGQPFPGVFQNKCS